MSDDADKVLPSHGHGQADASPAGRTVQARAFYQLTGQSASASACLWDMVMISISQMSQSQQKACNYVSPECLRRLGCIWLHGSENPVVAPGTDELVAGLESGSIGRIRTRLTLSPTPFLPREPRTVTCRSQLSYGCRVSAPDSQSHLKFSRRGPLLPIRDGRPGSPSGQPQWNQVPTPGTAPAFGVMLCRDHLEIHHAFI